MLLNAGKRTKDLTLTGLVFRVAKNLSDSVKSQEN